MEINQKGKIVQIIPEEKPKGWGFAKMSNHDYFFATDLYLWKHQQEPKHKLAGKIFGFIMLFGIFLFILEAIIIIILKYELPEVVGYIPVIFILVPIVILLIYNYFWDKKNRKPWYFDFPIPIQKPHDFKVGDEVNIKMEINHVPV